MHSKFIIASLLLAISQVLAAPYYQTGTTTCTKSTIATSKCTNLASTTATTTTKTCTKATKSTSSSIQPYYVLSSSSTHQLYAPTTTPVAPYILTTFSTLQPYTTPTASSTTDAFLAQTTSVPPPVVITSVTRITETATPLPTTVTVIPVPPSLPPKKLHCVQQWYGTAPFCNGKCPSNWNVVRYQRGAAKTCDNPILDKIIDRCDNTSKHGCSLGFKKALCEWCEMK
ncbi:hypothetical protein ABW20_dc0106547 [Dactylellina cionopaga]|nr:hypothetical protein ABW20_dc0106547 [Dactylellina cionopaga]